MVLSGNISPEVEGFRASNNEIAARLAKIGVRRRENGGASEVIENRMPLLDRVSRELLQGALDQ